ncbi:structural maintenance of chromosomes protein 5 [Drosophila bipectinata]|uniref:structural maintenance of chromosomes protein 5 n=1 Tax=Drosophila bipectinata TaxID=42026 RepID=UPI001C8917E6|nr:structural maintenance of chromosomes protein 5 [Drosophila bipectinata]
MTGHGDLSPEKLVGRIHSVYCKDFVSYSEITFHPKHYLNVLTGPNGSGKSTIVSAIILGLGGDPNLLDRSSSVSDYIQSNKTSATIIVRVYGKEPETTEAFRRIINSNGTSVYSVNNKNTTKSNFLAVVASYNIQVSNLCQFLPQDRVQDFSKMNPQELLLNTMSSVCDDELTQGFNSLKEMRASQATVNIDRDKGKNDLQKKQKRLEQMQQCVEQYKERQEIQQKLNISNVKKLWMETQAGEEKAKNFKDLVDNAKATYDEIKVRYDSKVRAQEQIQKKKMELQEDVLKKTQQLNKAQEQNKFLEKERDSKMQKVRESQVVLQQNIQRSVRSGEEANKLQKLVDNKKAELENFNTNKASVISELQKIRESLDSARNQAMRQYNKRKEIEMRLNDVNIPEVAAHKHRMNRLENVKIQKLEEISRRTPNLAKAMNWVAQNKQRYKCNVYDPMIFELSMQNNDASKYLENVVNARDLMAFSCEDKQDMSDLINELCVKQKLGVNVIYCNPSTQCMYTPKIPISELRSLGFHSYLVELVTGPFPIINKLCAAYGIQNIPIGSDAVGNNTSSIPKGIKIYFGGDKRYSVTTSRYRSDCILTESVIRGKNLLIAVDAQQLATVRKLHSQAVKEGDKLKNAMTMADNEFERIQIVIKDEQEKKKKLDQKVSYFNNLRSEVETLMEKLNSLRKTDALDAIKSNHYNKLENEMEKIEADESKLFINSEELKKCTVAKKASQTVLSMYTVQNASQAEALKELEHETQETNRMYKKLLDNLRRQLEDVNSRKEEIQRNCNGELPTSSKFPFKKEFKNMSALSLDQVRESIHDLEARLECMKNVNSEALLVYHELENEVKRLQDSIMRSSNEEKTIESNMSRLFEKWEPKLNGLVETISAKFSEFMESIEYIGEVVLSRADKYDFDSYGIQIMVQFRKGAQLQPLDKFIQSGGERAVSIAIYSLSLQHVTHVPFRCVDEINQGMDATNERHIFDLLLREATKHGSAQYLFVTPKLLRDLNYNEHLCVSIVHNSKTVTSGTKFPTI